MLFQHARDGRARVGNSIIAAVYIQILLSERCRLWLRHCWPPLQTPVRQLWTRSRSRDNCRGLVLVNIQQIYSTRAWKSECLAVGLRSAHHRLDLLNSQTSVWLPDWVKSSHLCCLLTHNFLKEHIIFYPLPRLCQDTDQVADEVWLWWFRWKQSK